MNRKHYTKEELKELMEAPPTREELEDEHNILSQIPIQFLNELELH
jgi:hypothetical protein